MIPEHADAGLMGVLSARISDNQNFEIITEYPLHPPEHL